jgi:HSP20 family protein
MRTVIPWHSRLFTELDGMQGIVGKILGEERQTHFIPNMNVLETDEHFKVSFDLPGIAAEDVSIEVHEGRLTLSGQREIVADEEGTKYHRMERRCGEFQRVLNLPEDVNEESILAEYVDGVLTLLIPKSERAQPRQIEVRTRGR